MDETTQQAEYLEATLSQLRDQKPRSFPADAIAEVREHREEFIPELLDVLKRCVTHVKNGELDAARDEPALIAFCLLIEFDVKEAWPITREMIRLPEDRPFDVLGDGIHEILPTAVALWGMDELEELREWCVDTTVNEYCRCSMSHGISDAYARGRLTRKEMLDVHRHWFEHAREEDYEIRALIICNLLDIHADELRDEIGAAFRDDLVETFMVNESCLEEFDKSKEANIERYVNRLLPLENFTDQLSSWAAFQPERTRKTTPRASHTVSRESPSLALSEPQQAPAVVSKPARVGRNDPCPCGSGKKYKKCCP